MSYEDVYSSWKTHPDAFWMKAAEAIDWVEPPSKALFAENAPLYEWFSDGMVNTCWNAVDRHVEAGRGDQLAIIHDSPITHSTKGITYRELRDRVALLAGALIFAGYVAGSYVLGVGLWQAAGRPLPDDIGHKAGLAMLGALVAGLVALVPMLGWLAWFALVFLGLGALASPVFARVGALAPERG